MPSNNFAPQEIILFIALTVIILIIRAISLWRSASLNQKPWFIVMLILGLYIPIIIDVAYLFFFSKKRLTLGEIKSWFGK